jgi:hypothetical protein
LAERLEISIDILCDFLFSKPEVANLILFGYFNKAPHEMALDIRVADYTTNIAIAMGLAMDKENVSAQAKARILAVWNSVLNFISGETFFRPILDVDRQNYLKVIKETLKFIMVPAFTLDK